MNANKLKNTVKTKTSLRSEKGMTLIDVAIATMVIGLLVTPVLYTINEFKRNETLDTTEANIAAVNDAIERYFIERNSFPCPANPRLPLTDANHALL